METPQIPLREKEDEGRKPQPGKTNPSQAASSGQVNVRVVAYEPKEGEPRRFDDMIDSGVASKDALLGLLRSGRHKIDDLAKSKSKQLQELTYDNGGFFVETNWSLSEDLVDKLKSLIDPFDILTPRALGAKIGAAVIILSETERRDG